MNERDKRVTIVVREMLIREVQVDISALEHAAMGGNRAVATEIENLIIERATRLMPDVEATTVRVQGFREHGNGFLFERSGWEVE